MYRHVICIVGLILAITCAHRADRGPVQVVDLLREVEDAEKLPSGGGFSLAAHAADGVVRAAIVVPVPSRVTIALPLPRRGELRASVSIESPDPAAAVRFRLGISDHRIYEALHNVVVNGAERRWVDVRADLSAYAGIKWSLFYRPDSIVWRLVLAADPLGGPGARAVWGSPEIVTDSTSAKEYVARRERLLR